MSKPVKSLKGVLNDINYIKNFVESDLKDVYLDSVFWPTKNGYINLVTIDANGEFDVYSSSEKDYMPYMVYKGKEFIVAAINSDVGLNIRSNQLVYEKIEATWNDLISKDLTCKIIKSLRKIIEERLIESE